MIRLQKQRDYHAPYLRSRARLSDAVGVRNAARTRIGVDPGGLARSIGRSPTAARGAECTGSFGTSFLRTTDLLSIEDPASLIGLLEFSLDGRHLVGGGGENGWLRLSSSTDNVIALSGPRVTFRRGNASGSGIIKVLFDQGSLRIDRRVTLREPRFPRRVQPAELRAPSSRSSGRIFSTSTGRSPRSMERWSCSPRSPRRSGAAPRIA